MLFSVRFSPSLSTIDLLGIAQFCGQCQILPFPQNLQNWDFGRYLIVMEIKQVHPKWRDPLSRIYKVSGHI